MLPCASPVMLRRQALRLSFVLRGQADVGLQPATRQGKEAQVGQQQQRHQRAHRAQATGRTLTSPLCKR